MRAAVERHGGRVEKFIGDAVSAVFGLPTAHEDDALRAVRSGVEMQERMAALNEASPIPLAARVGITTGEVLVPADDKPILGDAMNTASRLQTSAAPGEVLIGGPTWRLVRDAVVAEPVEPLTLKGKAEPVAAMRVLQVASLSPMRTRRLDAPMVGRDRESILLVQAYERAVSDRACQLFTVLGTAGAGKSRLVEEFLGGLEDAEVLQGRCLPYGDGITYYPVTEAMKGALGLADFQEESSVREAIVQAVAAEEHSEAITANLSKLLGAGEGGSPEETFWAIRRFFETRGRERPLVVVFDDIHWGEETFLDLIEHVAEWSRDSSILLLRMARPDLLDVRAGWSGGKTNATTISLAPLSESECDQLIDHLLGSSELPEQVRTKISRVAEGNPLFVEEMLRMLVDDSLLAREGERWVPSGDLEKVQVPPTISALLSSRLDRLSGEERLVLECGAIAGREFHRGVVLELLPQAARPGAEVHLRSLVRKELITPERSMLPGQDAYRFRHLLIRDAAYDQIPKTERAELHRRFADWLEAVAGDHVVEQEEIVGYHLERAYRYRQELGLAEDRELRLRAAKALGGAGIRADDRGDVTAATQLLDPAAHLAEGDPLELDLLRLLGAALVDGAQIAAAADVWTRLRSAAIRHGDAAVELLARAARYGCDSVISPEAWDLEGWRDLVDGALATFRTDGRFEEIGLNWECDYLWAAGRLDATAVRAAEALEVAGMSGHRRAIVQAIVRLSSGTRYGSAPLSESLDTVNALMEGYADDRAITATLLGERAFSYAWMGDPRKAYADADAAAAIDRELGRSWFLPVHNCTRGYAAWFEDGAAAAEGFLADTQREVAATGDREGAYFGGVPLARCLLELDRIGEAEEVVATFREVRGVPQGSIDAWTISAVIAARRGNLDRALQLSAEAEELAAATDLAVQKADVALDKAEILQRVGRLDEARASAEDALERFERKGYAIGIKRARASLEGLPSV